MSLGYGQPDSVVLPALIARLDDPDVVVRMAAHEELKRRTRRDFGYVPWASPGGAGQRGECLACLAHGSTDRHGPRAAAGEEELAQALAARRPGTMRGRTPAMAIAASTTAGPAAPGLPIWLAPAGWVGGVVVGALAYFGGVAVLLFSAAASLFSLSRDEDLPGFWAVMRRELGLAPADGNAAGRPGPRGDGLVAVVAGLLRQHVRGRHGGGGGRRPAPQRRLAVHGDGGRGPASPTGSIPIRLGRAESDRPRSRGRLGPSGGAAAGGGRRGDGDALALGVRGRHLHRLAVPPAP